MKQLFFIPLMFNAILLYCQEYVVARVSPDNRGQILVKWYRKKLITDEGCNVYRQTRGFSEWKKINAEPVRYKKYKVPQEDIRADKELQAYIDMSSSPYNLKGIALIALVVKTFSSEALCRYLGIFISDENTLRGNEYRYKIMALRNQDEFLVGSSDWVTAWKQDSLASPNDLQLEREHKNVRLRWQPEPDRYYGTHIYRKLNDTGAWQRLTEQPVLLSKDPDARQADSYPAFFYEDRLLPIKTKISYKIQGVDFFGQPTRESEVMSLVIPDTEAPSAVENLVLKAEGKRISLSWKKTVPENDLAGFHVYRTNNNDTDYTRITTELLSMETTHYTDSAPSFSSYMYKVSSVDRDGNERATNPHFIEAYDNEPPAQPQKLLALADTGHILLSWAKGSETDLAGYHIYRTINADEGETYVKLTPRPVACCAFTDTLEKRTKNRFLYRIVAVDKSLNRSPYSEPASAKMPDVTAPSLPFLKSVVRSDKGQVKLEWFANPEPDVSEYQIYRKLMSDSNSNFIRINSKKIAASTNVYEDYSIKKDGDFAYYLVAVDSAGNSSGASNTIRLRFRNKAQEARRIPELRAEYNARKKEVKLKWSSGSEALRGYIVYRIDEEAPVYESLTTFISDHTLKDGNIEEGRAYWYQVRAYYLNGDVAKSEEVNIITKQ